LNRIDAEVSGSESGAAVSPHPHSIGRYTILECIGEGGMGAVYRAQQHSPIERTVAVKLIKLGLDTPQVVRRFESERQALAWMDHPNIAKVLDAGADPVTGRPYFVMDYVGGVPITRYCDEQRLSNAQRLELFLQVCDAVAHAHQKMVVHRDLKPSNILVRSNNGPSTAHAKVIDFGVAKALVSKSTDRTMYTESGQMVGTPEYMSPEQARGAQDQDVDTRCDIYSLGVVLYELLAGALPFDPRTLRGSGPAGIERMICEVDPPRPSTRLSSLGESAGEIARRRQTQIEQLTRQLKSELEWIPLKAMRKERDQRYATVGELATDIRNYLSGRPLLAAPESRTYRLKKFLRRNRTGVAASVAMFALLVGGIAATSWQAIRAERQRRLAEERFGDIRDFSSSLIFDIHGDVAKLAGSQPAVDKLLHLSLQYLQKLNAESSDNFQVVRDASIGYGHLGDMQGNPNNNNRGDLAAATASYERSRDLAKRATSLAPDNTLGMSALASAELRLGDAYATRAEHQRALEQYSTAAKLMEEVARREPTEFKSRFNVVLVYQRIGRVQESLQSTKDVLDIFENRLTLARKLVADFPDQPRAPTQLARVLTALCEWQIRVGNSDGALRSATEFLQLQESMVARDPHNVDWQLSLSDAHQKLARVHEQMNDLDKATASQTRSLEIANEVHRKDPDNARTLPYVAQSQLRFAELAGRTERLNDANSHYEKAIDTYQKILTREPADRYGKQMLIYTLSSFGDSLAAQKKFTDSIDRQKQAIALLEPMVKAEPADALLAGGLAIANCRLGQVLLESGDPSAAIDNLHRSVELSVTIIANDPGEALVAWNLVETRSLLGDAHARLHQPREAREQYQQARDLAASLQSRGLAGGDKEILPKLDRKLSEFPGSP
jgi:non-specific serine/threonine protein kinase/serine/threonine-protein kinase